VIEATLAAHPRKIEAAKYDLAAANATIPTV